MSPTGSIDQAIRDRLALPLRMLCCAADSLGRPPAGSFRILLFHDVPLSMRDRFVRLIDDLQATHGFISPAAAESRLTGQAVPDGRVPMLLTFDDVFSCNLDLARTALAERGISALFFVAPDLLDQTPVVQNTWLRRDIHALALRLISWDGLAELVARGHTLGAHGFQHRQLSQLSSGELAEEVEWSAARLFDQLAVRPSWFAYPFGDIGSISTLALSAIGQRYRYCCSGVRGLNSATTHRLALLREHVDLGAAPTYRSLAAEGGLDLLHWKGRRRLRQMARAADA